jgi:hypothetical protein
MSGGSPALLVAENGRDYNVAKTHPTTPPGIVSSQGGRQISKSNVVLVGVAPEEAHIKVSSLGSTHRMLKPLVNGETDRATVGCTGGPSLVGNARQIPQVFTGSADLQTRQAAISVCKKRHDIGLLTWSQRPTAAMTN